MRRGGMGRAAAGQGLPEGKSSPNVEPTEPATELWVPGGAQLANKGYLEDRRPAANVDPYVVARLLLKTTFS